MGHVFLAAPTVERFHLHEQVGRRLMRRGHRVTLLATDPVTQRCYEAHGLPARLLEPMRSQDPAGFAVQDFAVRDLRLQGGGGRPDLRQLRRLRQRLTRRVAPLLRLFETEIPDLVVTTDGRSGLHRLIDAVARNFGCAVTHLGEGLLPGTMQRDPLGIDGDSAAASRAAGFYRVARTDRAFCDASLAAVLGEVDAPPVARRFVHPPDLIDRLTCLAAARSRAAWRSTVERLRAWQDESRRPAPRRHPVVLGLPREPFVAVLLQGPRDPRVLCDTEHGGPHAIELARAARRAVHAIDPDLGLVAVRGPGLDETALESIRAEGFKVRPAQEAAAAAATAAALITVNHPLAITGILAGTPVLHLGRALYAVPGVATATALDRLRPDLLGALEAPANPTLRARFASHLLAEDHIWCAAEGPDPNGLRGIVTHLEDVLRRAAPPPEPTPYRAGPSWPLVRGS
jgi:hypothetical protein